MHHFADDMDRLVAQVDQETKRGDQQGQPETGCSDLRHQPVADVIAVQSARIDETVLESLAENESQENGKPDQEQGTGQKPFPHAETVGFHQLHARHAQENGDKVRGDAKTVVNQVTGQLGPA